MLRRVAPPTVDAVIVNHNTSLFSELALRSLVASQHEGRVDLSVFVRDNHSDDADLAGLRAAVADVGAVLETTRWPATSTPLNTHGDVLRDFVLDRPGADYYLFVDCDIDFEEPRTVDLMVEDLDADDSLWAVQARFRTAEARRADGTLDVNAGGAPVALDVRRRDHAWTGTYPVAGRIQSRCHPGATLVRNTPTLRRLADLIGFSTAAVLSADPTVAGFHDTFGLATTTMAVHGLGYGLSRATVHHFFCVSYDLDKRDASAVDGRARLQRFSRSGTSTQ